MFKHCQVLFDFVDCIKANGRTAKISRRVQALHWQNHIPAEQVNAQTW
jgi:hypothetical protein